MSTPLAEFASQLRTARAAFQAGQMGEAQQLCSAMLSQQPPVPEAWHLAAAVQLRVGKPDRAATILARAIGVLPQEQSLWLDLIKILYSLRQFVDAEKIAGKALAVWPDAQGLQLLQGATLHAQQRLSEAAILFERVRTAAPESVEAHFGAALAAHDLWKLLTVKLRRDASTNSDLDRQAIDGQFDRACSAYRQVLTLQPAHAEAANNLGHLLVQVGKVADGEKLIASAVASKPQLIAARQNHADALLRLGRYTEAWQAYRWRNQLQPDGTMVVANEKLVGTIPTLPQDLSGKHVVLVAEQGLGDVLFFLRYAPLLKHRGARVSFWRRRRLVPLLEASAWLDEVLADDTQPAADAIVLRVGDLPFALGLGVQESVVPPLALTAPEVAVEQVRARLAELGPPPYIGLTWRAGSLTGDDETAIHKRIPLADLGTALRDVPGTLIALQRQPLATDIPQLAEHAGRTVHDLTQLNEDLPQMLALLHVLDDYIGVSNTNMHLRAGTGRAARVLVQHPAEWRWAGDGESSPWYPGFRVYREAAGASWTGAMQRLTADLRREFSPAPH